MSSVASRSRISSGTPNPTDDTRRPYPQYGTINYVEWDGNSHFHSLMARVQKTYGYGLSFLASYTFSKSIDDLGTLTNQRDFTTGRGLSSFDIRHRFSAGPSYDLPGKHGYWQMLQGWRVSSTAKVWSGSPINPIDSTDDISGTGENVDRWSLAGNPHDFNGFGTSAPIPCSRLALTP